MAKKVYIPEAVAREGEDFLLEQGYEIAHGSALDPDTFRREVADCDAVLLRTMPCPEELLAAGNNLKIVARHGVGYDNVDVAAAEKLGIHAVGGNIREEKDGANSKPKCRKTLDRDRG